MTVDPSFWRKKQVFLTGHTGFKGSWLTLWLANLGAQVWGYSLLPPTQPNLFQLCQLDQISTSTIGDIREPKSLEGALLAAKPEVVIHMAAQALVRKSYLSPIETYAVNVLGTVNLLEAVRVCPGIKAIIIVTTDKCYENREWVWSYRENETLGGYDPYSSSKACSELVTAAYRSSYFNPVDYAGHGVALASVRAGNVIGGGDWAADRLIPETVKTLFSGGEISLRSPGAIRPWQHVLEPLAGYLTLAQKLYLDGPKYGEAWNFGPEASDEQSVCWVVKTLCQKWGENARYKITPGHHPHEAATLKLDCAKAKSWLGWYPRWNLDQALSKVVEWYKAFQAKQDLTALCLRQIEEYSKQMSEAKA